MSTPFVARLIDIGLGYASTVRPQQWDAGMRQWQDKPGAEDVRADDLKGLGGLENQLVLVFNVDGRNVFSP